MQRSVGGDLVSAASVLTLFVLSNFIIRQCGSYEYTSTMASLCQMRVSCYFGRNMVEKQAVVKNLEILRLVVLDMPCKLK